uniref:Pathogen-related protein n=1 Tax=Kalanchoe fedtschenkoi TaxID=63787 RepID=A0A7N0VGB9_KALFE
MGSAGKTDAYRSFLHGEGEIKTQWRFGAAPSYDVVNKLFEQGRTKIWPEGSIEETVQNLVKTWEMEMFHKKRAQDIKSIDTHKYTFNLNGRKALNLKEIGESGGGYNPLLQTSLPDKYRSYNPDVENYESSHVAFTTAFPRGFAVEVIQVYSGPPKIAYKFRHWGIMEGPFTGHAPTGEMVQFYGIGIFEVDDKMKLTKVELFYDPGELLGGLLRGPSLNLEATSNVEEQPSLNCPFLRNTG